MNQNHSSSIFFHKSITFFHFSPAGKKGEHIDYFNFLSRDNAHTLFLVIVSGRPRSRSRIAMATIHNGRNPFNQNFRKFRSKTEWIG